MKEIISIWKPENITSYDVIRKIKFFDSSLKIGHCGTLDPFATGILAIALGEATKSIRYLNQDKIYKFNVVFGELKDTDDVTGKTMKKSNIVPTSSEIDQCIEKFIGKHRQIPPQFSAVKVNGKRAYKLARDNQKFVLKAKDVLIENIKCMDTKNKKEALIL